MTTITFYRDSKDNFIGFEANGHSGFAKSGNDVVCSAISVTLITLINSIEEFTDAVFTFEENSDKGYMKFLIEDNNSAEVQLLFKASHLGLVGVQENYSKYLKLTNRRYKP